MEQWKREIPGYEADAATPYMDKQTLCYPALKQLTLCPVPGPGSRPVTTWICVSSENSHSAGSQTCAPQLPEPSLFTPPPCQAGVSSLREGRSPGRVMKCSPAFPQVVFLVFRQSCRGRPGLLSVLLSPQHPPGRTPRSSWPMGYYPDLACFVHFHTGPSGPHSEKHH